MEKPYPRKPQNPQNAGDALTSALFMGNNQEAHRYATDPDAPVQLKDYTIEVPVTKEDGNEAYVLLSTNFSQKPRKIFALTKNYQAYWYPGSAGHFAIRRSRNDLQPLLDMGLCACVETDQGTDFPDPKAMWDVLNLDGIKFYRNGPFFFHQMEKGTVLFRVPSQLGGSFEFGVTFEPAAVRYECAYLPPETLVGAGVKAIQMLLHEDGSESPTDGEEIFVPFCTDHGWNRKPISQPAQDRNAWAGYMTPPLCYPIRRKGTQEWFTLSLAPEKLDFSSFNTQPGPDGRIALRLDYAVTVPVEKVHKLPAVLLRFPYGDQYEALKDYAEGLVRDGCVERPVRKIEPWWNDPIVCGWREQTLWMQKCGGSGYDYCTQEIYEDWNAKLEELEIPYGTMVIDAIWSKEEYDWTLDTEKWRDMRGFIDKLHAQGRHALLWICPVAKGLPDDECILMEQPNGAIQRLMDPFSPKHRARITECLRVMLSDAPGCLNADGLKLDYTGGMPAGKPIRFTKPVFGYDYLKAQYQLYHDGAKAAKADCLLEYQVANPHMAGTFDMTRLNDYVVAPGMNNAFDVMEERMKIASCVNFGTPIDVDGIRSPEYIRRCSELGVPSMYLGIEDFDRTDEYAKVVRKCFTDWREKQASMTK